MATKDLKTFTWKATNKQGKEISGQTNSANASILNAFLAQQGLAKIVIKEKPKPLFESKGRIKNKDIIFFTRQMSTMIEAGMPLIKALELVGNSIEKPIKMREVVLDIQQRIENGASFAEALASHPLYFDRLYTSLVAAGEEGGLLEKTMSDLAENLEKGESTKKKVKKALQYPIIVMIFATIVTTVLMVKVVPTFTNFFVSNGGELPFITQVVVNISDFMVDIGLYLLVVLVVAIFIFLAIKKRNIKVQQASNKFALKMPIIGNILKTGANARFARTMSSLFEAGVPIIRALESTGPATGSILFENALVDIKEDMQNGQLMSFAMRNTGLFPPIAVQMTAIGEESGNLGDMLGRVAHYYEEELDWRIDALTAMIEPLIMAFLAIVVGGILIAIYLPMFYMGSLF